MLGRVATGLLAAGALLAALAPAARASRPVRVSCGATITADTKLANDLVDCPGIGIVIGADDVTLDLNGHTIDGDGIVDFEGVQAIGHDEITVRGGAIRDFVEGVAVIDARDVRLRDLSVANSRHVGVFADTTAQLEVQRSSFVDTAFAAIFVTRSDDVEIERNLLSRNGAGISVVDTAKAVVTGNVVTQNGFAAIQIESDGAQVDRNRLSDTGLGMIVFASHTAITDNTVADAVGCIPSGEMCVSPPPGPCPDCVDGYGIWLEGGTANLIARNDVARTRVDGVRLGTFDPENPTTDTVVRDNAVRDAAADGFSIATEGGDVSGSLLERNTATRSGDDGFDIRSAATTLTRNTANRNQDFGIEAVAGAIDGGGNRARGNGNPLQCINVICR